MSEERNGNRIAVVGMACRFPRAKSIDSFWDLLISGRDATSELPQERWPVADLVSDDRKASGTLISPRAGLLDDIKGFDARFFSITPREAEAMDPQQRIALEVAYEAIEDAGLVVGPPQKTGVFVGAWSTEYSRRFYRQMPNETLQYWGTGNAMSILSNRISYAFNFRGTSMTVDTASSSSLLAIHLACRAIEAGDIERAVVGGVNLLIDPITSVYFTKIGALSPDGLSKSFDADANGYVRAEGCGFVVLERVTTAEARRQKIYAHVVGTGTNQDGRSPGLTVPSGEAQAELIRETLARAKLAPSDISYVEAHASGTPVGDPIEMAAIGEAYAGERPEPLRIGSVKSNIGHLEAAAGMAGFIKTVLSVERGELPPTLHFQSANREIRLDHFEMRVQNTHTAWPKSRSRIAAVNSFGLGGTNVHALVGQAGSSETLTAGEMQGQGLLPLILTARSESALKDCARRMVDSLRKNTGASMQGIAGTLALRRSHYEHRLVAVGSSKDEWIEKLEVFLDGGSPDLFATATTKPSETTKRLVFVFSGQGAHWLGMGRQLFAENPSFKQELLTIASIFRELSSYDLLAEFEMRDAQRLDRLDIVQPMVFAINLAMVRALQMCGVVPEAVVGHSQGEVAAAVVAGILSLRDACKVMLVRSSLLESTRGKGQMAVVGIAGYEAEELCAEFGSNLSVAAVNSPRTTVISGATDDVLRFVSAMNERGTFAKVLNAGWAAHHAQMDPLREKLIEELGSLRWAPPTLQFVSTATLDDVRDFGAEYWWKNLRNPVQFYSAIDALAEAGTTFVELSPHPGLKNAIVETIRAGKRNASYVSTLQREAHEPAELLRATAELFVEGHSVAWHSRMLSSHSSVSLPSYPWEHNSFWIPISEAIVPSTTSSALENRPPSVHPSAVSDLSFVASIRSTPRNERTSVARARVAEVVYRLAKLGRRKGDPETPLKTLGFDSILFRTLEGELEDELGVTSSAALLMSYGTIAGISDALLEQIFASGSYSVNPEDAPTLTSLEAIAALDKMLEGLE